MHLVRGNLDALAVCGLLTVIAAFLTLVFSAIGGTTLAFFARPNFYYGAALATLFIPFAIGGSVWAYALTRLFVWWGWQHELVSGSASGRAATLLALNLARTLPLGIFFCATNLQRYTAQIGPYFQIHRLRLPFFLFCGLNRISRSVLLLLGLFGGSLMAMDASLPIFLYRANPGTEPETPNIMLARLFREIYASTGPGSLTQVAILGVYVSLILLMAALLGALAGQGCLRLLRSGLETVLTGHESASAALSVVLRSLLPFSFAPGILALLGLLLPGRLSGPTAGGGAEILGSYQEIVWLGALVGVTISSLGIALAVKLRYAPKDLLAAFERSPWAACLLLLPSFVPVLSIVALLGRFSHGQMAGALGYFSLFISHVALHYPVFQFICMTLIASIPERHVAWQRAMKFRYSFSLLNDGFKRNAAIVISLIGLGVVQVVTDGSISRWFAHLVKAPEEALYAAVFGRLSNATEATLISWTVAAVGIAVCVALAVAYVRELKGQRHHA